MVLQERWEANEARKAFVLAMTEFKAEPLEIFKRKQVGYTTKEGDFVGYKHAELSDVTDVVVPAMARHGLSHRWDVRQDAGRVTVSCTVTHRMGHSESVTMDAAPDDSGKKNKIQQIASAVQYLSRYTILAVTGMSTKSEHDDDGAGTGDGSAEARREQWLKDQLANIAGARSGKELNSVMKYALETAAGQDDDDMVAKLQAACEAKRATAKPKTEGA